MLEAGYERCDIYESNPELEGLIGQLCSVLSGKTYALSIIALNETIEILKTISVVKSYLDATKKVIE